MKDKIVIGNVKKVRVFIAVSTRTIYLHMNDNSMISIDYWITSGSGHYTFWLFDLCTEIEEVVRDIDKNHPLYPATKILVDSFNTVEENCSYCPPDGRYLVN